MARIIIRTMETGEAAVIYGNVPNRGLITNLPDGCCVEVPCLVDDERRPAGADRRAFPSSSRR